MGSAAGQHNMHSKLQQAQMTYFNKEINKMKYQNCQLAFKQKSDETKLALSSALVNLRKNKLLDTSQFKFLQGDGSKINKKDRLKTEKGELVKKMILGNHQKNVVFKTKNKSQHRINRYLEQSLQHSLSPKNKNRNNYSIKY